jgi:hypothetical protein
MTTLYHGTQNNFTQFNTEIVFFTTNIEMAKSYGSNIIERKVDVSNVICVDAKGENWRGFFLGDNLANEIYHNMVKNDFVYYSIEELKKLRFSTNDVVSFAKDLGKDVIKISNVEDYGSEVENIIPCDVFVVLNKNLIN